MRAPLRYVGNREERSVSVKVFTEKRTITKTNIGWCTHTWNPVWGCNCACSYCYASGIARRFASVIAEENDVAEDDIRYFKPTWLENNFNREFPKKPARIFVNSMSDISHWKAEWLIRVFDRISEHPEHQFIFLTKQADWYWSLLHSRNQENVRRSLVKAMTVGNIVLGVTATTGVQAMRSARYLFNIIRQVVYSRSFPEKTFTTMISIEPIHEYMDPEISVFKEDPPYFKDSPHPDWLIIGPETGNRINKVIPKRKWFDVWVSYCMKNNIPLWEKESVRQYVGRDLVQETPWEKEEK